MLESIGSVAFLAFLLLQDPAPASGWKVPPLEVVEIVDAPSPPRVVASPDAQLLLLVETPELPPLEDVARPWVGLAGVRINPETNDRYQTSFSTGILVRGLQSEPIGVPPAPE